MASSWTISVNRTTSDLNLNHLPPKHPPFSSFLIALSILREGRGVSSHPVPRPQAGWSREAGPLKPLAAKPQEAKLSPP